MLTKAPIEAAMKAKQEAAIMQVLPQVEGLQVAEAEDANGITLYKAYVGEEWVGTAVEATTEGNVNMPFGGTFRLMVGFDNVGNVVNYVVLEQAETPGLGALMVSWFCNAEKPGQNIIGKNPATTNFTVSKDGGDVDAITASTITSRAFLEVVVKAYNGIAHQDVEAVSSATQLHEENVVVEEDTTGRKNCKERGRENCKERGRCKNNNVQEGGQQ